MAEQTNISKMKVNEMIQMMVPLIMGSKKGKELPAINLSGAPGVGKSDGVRAIAKDIQEKTGKKVYVHDVRLLNMNPVDLRGIPAKDTMTANVEVDGEIVSAEVAVARWLRPAIFQMDPSPEVVNILFLDEITAAPQSVQAAAYQLVLDRKVGEHLLPDNTFVFCAGNRVGDKSVAYRMPKALANRLCHLEVYADVDDWKGWALLPQNNIDERIVGFISFKRDMLFKFDASNDDMAYPTPRSWEMVDRFLKKINNLDLCYPMIAGCIGNGAATEFVGYTQVYQQIPNVEDIFKGKKVEYPKKADVCYALSSAIVSYSRKASEKEISNMINWVDGWAADFAVVTIKDCIVDKNVKSKIGKSDAWVKFAKTHRTLIEN